MLDILGIGLVLPPVCKVRDLVTAAGGDPTCRTGPEYGHVGGADLMIGLRRLIDTGKLDKPVAVSASVPYAMGAGLVTAPRPS